MSAVSEIMPTRAAVTIRVELTPSALDAAKLMISRKVGSVVVVDHDGKPIGIITERDILKNVAGSKKDSINLAAQDIMSHPVITIKVYDSIETAAAAMAKNRIKRLVVLEQDGSLAGVLSITDIARKLAKILATDYKRYGQFNALMDS